MRTWHVLLLVTARAGAAVFLLVFLASTFRRLWKKPWTSWLMRTRRTWGLSFAAIMALHLIAIFVLMKINPRMIPEMKADPFAPLGGAVGYLFLAAMAATSNDWAVRRLGPRRWQRLHSAGMYVLWVVFAFTYAVRAGLSVEFLLTAAVFAAALPLKLAMKRKPGVRMSKAG